MTEPTIVAWVGIWKADECLCIWGSAPSWGLTWWEPRSIACGFAHVAVTKPEVWPQDPVRDVRAISQDELDLLVNESRARTALGI